MTRTVLTCWPDGRQELTEEEIPQEPAPETSLEAADGAAV